MTALSISRFSFLNWTFRTTEPKVEDSARHYDAERRKIVGHMIAAGACNSEHGVQMLMSVFPDQF